MGAPEKLFTRFVPKEKVGEATTWEFQPLSGDSAPRATEKLLSDRERRAYERGRTEGYAEGQRDARAERRQYDQALERVFADLRNRFSELETQGADRVFDLALTIARQVVRREVELDREAVLPALREAVLAIIEQHAAPRVMLHPADYALLADTLPADGLLKGCQFIADARITRGGCRVETPAGEVDATLENRWRRVLDALGSAEAPPPQPFADGAENADERTA